MSGQRPRGPAVTGRRKYDPTIEAASRTGQALAGDALVRLAEATSIAQTDWAQGIYARSRALVSDGAGAERLYREAIERLGRTGFRSELARAHLLFGEWLRREGRRAEARDQLRTAHNMLDAIGMRAFADRARRELLATGETVRKRTADTSDPLTPKRPRSPGWPERAVEPGDRRPAVPQPAHRRVPPGQGLHQARYQLPPSAAATRCPTAATTGHTTGHRHDRARH